MTPLSAALGLLVFGAGLLWGGHDLWIATPLYLAALALAGVVALRDAWTPKAPGLDRGFALAAAGLLAAFWTSFLFAARPEDAWLEAMDWTSAALVFLLALRACRSERSVELLLVFPVAYAVLELWPLIFERYTRLLKDSPQTDTAIKWFWRILGEQPAGSFPNSSPMAAFLILWLPALGQRAFHTRSWRWRALAAATFLAFLMLNSVWGVLCLGACLLLAVRAPILRLVKRHPRLALGASAAALAAGVFLVWWKLSQRVDWSGNPVTAAQRFARLAWWHAGLRMFLDNPWLGVGPGNYGSAYLAYRTAPVQNSLFAHSLPVTLLAETGLIGTLAFAGFTVYAGARIFRAKLSPEREGVAIGAFGFLLFSMISISAEYLAALMGFFLALGVAAAPSARGELQPRKPAALVLALALLASTPWVVSPWLASRLIVAADEDLSAQRLDDALRRYQAAAETDPRAWEAPHGLARAGAVAFRRSGSVERLWEAVRHQRRAVALDRMNRGLRYELEVYEGALTTALAAQSRPRPRAGPKP